MAKGMMMVTIQIRYVTRKPVLGCLRPAKAQTSLLSYSDELEPCKFGFIKYRYDTIYALNNKDAGLQFVYGKTGFSWRGS